MDPAGRQEDDEGHIVHSYDEATLTTEVGRSMCGALGQGYAVLCVATGARRRLLEGHLTSRGIDVRAADTNGQLVFLDAFDTLDKIIIDGMPDVVRFAEVLGARVDRAAERYPRVWIFGELVALMGAAGNHAGAAELEELWTSFTASRPIFLYCAYPAHAFASEEDRDAFLRVCEEHRRVLQSDS